MLTAVHSTYFCTCNRLISNLSESHRFLVKNKLPAFEMYLHVLYYMNRGFYCLHYLSKLLYKAVGVSLCPEKERLVVLKLFGNL